MTESDVTIAHGSSTLPACAIAGLGPGRPFVYRQISDPEVWQATPLRRLRSRLALSRASHVVALSNHNRAQLERYLGLDTGRCTVIPNAVPIALFAPVEADGRAKARGSLGLADGPDRSVRGHAQLGEGPGRRRGGNRPAGRRLPGGRRRRP